MKMERFTFAEKKTLFAFDHFQGQRLLMGNCSTLYNETWRYYFLRKIEPRKKANTYYDLKIKRVILHGKSSFYRKKIYSTTRYGVLKISKLIIEVQLKLYSNGKKAFCVVYLHIYITKFKSFRGCT